MGCQVTGSDISLQEELIKRQAEMHWAHVKDAYDKGFFHLPGQLKNQQNTSLQEEINITPSLNFLVENSEETSDKNNTSLAKCKRLASIEVLATGKPPSLETGSQALFREPNRFTLPPLRSLSAGNRRTPLQDNLTSCAASSRRHPTGARQLPGNNQDQDRGESNGEQTRSSSPSHNPPAEEKSVMFAS